MKLHIECLQEKLDSTAKDQKRLQEAESQVTNLQKELQNFVQLSKKVEEDSVKLQQELSSC